MIATILFLFFLLAVGFHFRRRTRDAAGYYLAGRELGAWQVGLSMAATSFGSSALLIASLMVYNRGLPGIWFSLAVALGFAASGMWFAGRVRASGAHSLADFVGRTYGEGVRRIVSALLVVVQIGFFGLTVTSFALLTQPVFSAAAWPIAHPRLYLTVVCAVFVVYPMLGGQKADVFSNMVKIVAVCALLLGVLLPLALARADWTQLPRGWLAFPISKTGDAVYVLNMLCLMGLPGIVGGDVFATILSARDERAARRGMLLAGAVRAALSAGVALLALCARAMLPGLAHPELCVPLLARDLLPDVLFQLITLVFLMSLISTGDTVLLTASTVLALDVFKLGERAGAGRLRIITLALAALGLLLGFCFPGILEIMRFSYTLLSAAIIMPVLGMLTLGPRRRPAKGWVIAAIAAGLAGAQGWKMHVAPYLISPPAPFPYSLDPAAVGVACSACMIVAGAFARGGRLEDDNGLRS